MKRVLCMLLIVVVALTSIWADDALPESVPTYSQGSQMFTFRFGPVVPTFIYMPEQTPSWFTFDETHFKTGGYGAIRYQGFLNSYLAIGGELGYLFDYDQSNLFTSVPFQAKLTYIPLQGTFEIPISFGLGFAYNTYLDSSFLSLFSSAEIGASLFFTESWGISVSGGLQFVPGIYFGDKADQSAYTGFLPITLSISYRSN